LRPAEKVQAESRQGIKSKAAGIDPTAIDTCSGVAAGGRNEKEKDQITGSGSGTSSTGTLLRRNTLRLTLPMMASSSLPRGC